MKLIWMMAINRMIPFGWFFEGFSDHLQANFGWFCHILPYLSYLNPPVGSEIWIPSGGSRYIDVHPGKRTWQWRNKPFEDVSPMKNGNDFQPMTWESHEWTENNSLLQWSFEGVFGCRTAIKWYAYMIFTNIVSFDFVQRYRKKKIYMILCTFLFHFKIQQQASIWGDLETSPTIAANIKFRCQDGVQNGRGQFGLDRVLWREICNRGDGQNFLPGS